MTTEEKFNAAVNVIRSLPKDGAYQPAYELRLRFYSYYKQATEGPCRAPKPPFWEVVKKLKWEAWMKLGNMSKQEAMDSYVEELKKIVETMSYNANVETFLGSLGNFYDTVPVEDLEMLLGPVIERVRSQPGSPLKGSPLVSRETSPSRIPRGLAVSLNGSSLETSSMKPPPHPVESEDDDEYIDTVETASYSTRRSYKSSSSSPVLTKRSLDLKDEGQVRENGYGSGHSQKENGIGNGVNGMHNGVPYQMNGNGHHYVESDDENLNYAPTRTRVRSKESPRTSKRAGMKQNGGPKSGTINYATDVSDSMREVVLDLQKDLDRINSKIRSLEVHVLSQTGFLVGNIRDGAECKGLKEGFIREPAPGSSGIEKELVAVLRFITKNGGFRCCLAFRRSLFHKLHSKKKESFVKGKSSQVRGMMILYK